jgi:septal ring factor EnvC (AmiA/AmiB activator)
MFASSKKAKLEAEIKRLENELLELSDNLSESQVGYKRAKIQQLKQELADMDKNQFNSASDKLKQDMSQQDMMAAMAQGQGRS